MPYYGDGAPYYYGGGPFSNHSSLMTGVGRYHNPIAARYSPHLSTISETPFVVLRRYSPAASATTCSATLSRPRRIIDTADIDVTKPPRSLAQDNRQQRHRLRRDRPTIKIRSQALKDNPALREYNERHEKTVGELLVEKFLIKDKQTLEAERKMKLYHQASLARDEEPSLKERENDILAAIRRRVTRRMTRRRSSADVIPLDPEQIEREAALQAAQAVALDELVAEEQAEIEIEVRRGTFAKRQAMRLPAEVSELSQTEDDEMEAEDRKNDKKHVAKKKKRRKSLERPLPSKSEEEEDEDEEEEIHIPESVIEEEEFEWDDREKCDDVRQIVPVQEEAEVKGNDLRTDKSEVKIEDKKVNLKSDVKKTDLKIKSDAKVVEKEIDRKILESKREDKVEQKIVESKKKDKAEEKVAKPKEESKVVDKIVELKKKDKEEEKIVESKKKDKEEEKVTKTKKEDKVVDKIVESKKKDKEEEKVATPKEESKVVDKIVELKKKDKEEEKIVESKKKDTEEEKVMKTKKEDKVVDKIVELKKKDKEKEKILEFKKKDKAEEKVAKPKEESKVVDKIVELKKKDKEEEKIVESKKKDKEEEKVAKLKEESKVVDKNVALKKKDKEEEKIVESKKKDKEEEKVTKMKEESKVEEKIVELKKKDKEEEKIVESKNKDKEEEKIIKPKEDDKVEEMIVELKKKDKMEERVIKMEEDKIHEKIIESKEEDKVAEKIVESKTADKLEKDKVEDRKKAEEKDEKNLEVTIKDRKPNKDKAPKPEEKPKTKEQKRDLKEKAPKTESHARLKRTTSAPQWQAEPTEPVPRFKIEACNSVGDMSTLYVKSANSPAEAFRSIEQFRESIRLPAPRRPVPATIETQVVLPVRKPYVLDTSRNSVYLALKPSQKQLGADDGSSIIIDGSRKESSIAPRPAKSGEVGGDRRTTEDDTIISEVTDAAAISDEAEKGFEALLEDKGRKSVIGGREEFVSWWDETPEEQEEIRAEIADAIAEQKLIECDKIAAEDKSDKVADKTETVAADEALKREVSPKVDVDKVTANIVNDKAFKREVSPKVEVDKVTINKVSDKPVKREVSPKVDLDKATANKVCDLQDKSATVEEVADKRVKSVEIVIKDKPANKIADVKEKAPKSPLEKEVKAEEKLKPADTQKKAQPLPKVSSEREKKERKSREDYKEEYLSSPVERKLINHDVARVKNDLPKIDHHHLPKIPEEPKSASPTEKRAPFTSQPKTNEPNNKSLFAKKAEDASIKSNLAPPRKEREERKNRVDAEAVMKIEKKILEEAESPSKILTSAIPERIIEVTPLTPSTKKEEEGAESQRPEKKVGLPTKKKSAETAAAAAAATEIDFWSEIKAQESERVSGTPSKVQSPIDEEASQQQQQQRPEKLKLDLSGIKPPTAEREELRTPLLTEQEEPRTPLPTEQEEATTPLIPEPEDLHTPLVEEPATPLAENLSEVPPLNLTEERSPTVIYNGIGAQTDKPDQDQKAEEELSGTVKKISKWTNRDNLSNLNDADNEATPVASKEVSPQVSAPSSTTKKKVVKRKKSSTAAKKKSEKGESTKTSTKKAPAKKVAASPQTSLLKTPMSATGSPRNTPNQRPDDLKKLFYTTPQILLTATPRDLRKVRRAKVKRKKPPTRTPSLSSDSTGSTRSTATTSTEEGSNCEEDAEQKRLASTRSNDSGFDGSPRLSTPSQSSENQRNADGDHYHHSGRITPPATNLPRFKKYEVTDFNFLKVLGKGSFGKVLLAELRGTECVYAVKCLKKDVVLEDDDVECTLIERKVLTLATRHPYLCHLFCTFQTDSHLFFVMEYLNGGDLMFHIQKSGRFSEQRAKFYAAEIWSGLIFLHKKGIVYRDLKLDNVLLDFEGHIRIADFGMCKLQIFLDRTADTFCGTPDYMAPEIIKGLKYNQAVDWWSYGVLLYEMLTGQSPFSGCDEDELFWSICNERPFIPRYLSQSSTDILVCLLEKDAGKRIPGHEIACHPFFCTIAWDKLERRTLEPPFKPAVEHTLDTRYFDTAFTTERPRLTPVPEQILSSMDQEVFRGFSYTNPNATD